jgi:hypothetical protein
MLIPRTQHNILTDDTAEADDLFDGIAGYIIHRTAKQTT